MATLVMPRLGETVTEGMIVKWLKKEGDFLKKEEPVVEISTDKVETDIPSPIDGVLRNISVTEGQKVAVGQKIAEIEEITEATKAAPKVIRPMARVKAVPEEVKKPEGRGVISPIVRKLAKEKGINLEEVKGSGFQGRITKADILRIAEKKSKAKVEVEPVKPAISKEIEIKPLSIIRKQEAEHLLESQKNMVQVTAINEADFTNIDKLLKVYKEKFKVKEGFSLTYLPFVAKAVIQMLEKRPVFNAELKDDEVWFKPHINLGIAVALEDGLIVPVIKQAENLSLVGLARSINDMATRARSGKLKPDEVHEGTFTITNNGSFGSLMQTPIIVSGQVAILSLEAVTKRVSVIDDCLAIRKKAYLPLTYDHRLIDGALASTFLVELKEIIEGTDFSAELEGI